LIKSINKMPKQRAKESRLVTENFIVKEVVVENKEVLITTESDFWNTPMGSRIPRHHAGYVSETILNVKPDSDIPTRTLIFKGS